MRYVVIRRSPDELRHHGVPGQRWGFRKDQTQSSIPSAKGGKHRDSDSESTRSKDIKKVLKVVGGIAVTAAVAYGAYKGSEWLMANEKLIKQTVKPSVVREAPPLQMPKPTVKPLVAQEATSLKLPKQAVKPSVAREATSLKLLTRKTGYTSTVDMDQIKRNADRFMQSANKTINRNQGLINDFDSFNSLVWKKYGLA